MSKKHNKMSKEEKEIRQEEAQAEQSGKTSESAENTSEKQAEAKESTKESRKEEKKASKEIEDLTAKLEAAQKEIDSTKAALAKEKDDYVRLMADFDNFRRHSSEDKLKLVSTAAADTILGLLPVLDDCERAMAILADSADENAKQGTSLIYTKLLSYLKSKGLEAIDAKGKKFDTDMHEAVAQFPVPEEDKKGLVYDVLQTGYTLGGKVIRYAKVVVAI